jgi:hypothetical protein
MNDKERTRKEADAKSKADDDASKGQYGGLKGLGPGGGRDIKDAAETEDINTSRGRTPRK